MLCLLKSLLGPMSYSNIDLKSMPSPPMIMLNFDLLKNYEGSIIKIKQPFFLDIFKVLDNFVSDFCSNEKIILSKNHYDDFIQIATDDYFNNRVAFGFEYDLHFIVSLIYILIENNVLELYYNIFITNNKEKFTKNLFSNGFPQSLIERMDLNKLSLNLSKKCSSPTKNLVMNKSKQKMLEFEKNDENIIKEKEDLALDNLFSNLKQKKNKNTEKEHEEPFHSLFIPPTFNLYENTFNSLTIAFDRNVFNNFIDEEEKTKKITPISLLENNKIERKKSDYTSKNYKGNKNNYNCNNFRRTNSYRRNEDYNTEVCFVAKTNANQVNVEALIN